MNKPTDSTELTEMNEFFPVGRPTKKPVASRAIPMQPGETYEEAVKRHDERTARIQQQNAAKRSA